MAKQAKPKKKKAQKKPQEVKAEPVEPNKLFKRLIEEKKLIRQTQKPSKSALNNRPIQTFDASRRNLG